MIDAFDIRTSKIINSNHRVDYILDGTQILKETHTGSTNYEIEYYYDINGNIIGFTYNNNNYMYIKNLQNDIIGIVDELGNVVVKYYYEVRKGSSLSGWKAQYILGDFTACLSVAESYYKNQYYPKYNLFEKNCLHYVLEILSYGDFYDEYLQNYVTEYTGTIPTTFYEDVLNVRVGTASGPYYFSNSRLFSYRGY